MKQYLSAQAKSSSGPLLGRSLAPLRSQLIPSEPEKVVRSPELNDSSPVIVKSGHCFANLALYAPERSTQPVIQSKRSDGVWDPQQAQVSEQTRPNRTGLPDRLKTGIEALSGIAMDDVKVHYNSDKPAQVQALAYTQGANIYVGAGQERHLPHEAWHVVQQKQRRVQPTLQAKGMGINNDHKLEQEADQMGAIAIQRWCTNQSVGNSKVLDPYSAINRQTRSKATPTLSFDPVLSPGGEAPIQAKILGTTLYAYGNTSKPSPLRNSDIPPDSEGDVAAQVVDLANNLPLGKSVSGNYMNAPLTGHVWEATSDKTLGAGTDVVADGTNAGGSHYATHHTIYPTVKMKFTELESKFQGIGWTRIGNRKPTGFVPI